MIDRIKEAIDIFVAGDKEEKEEPKLILIDPASLQPDADESDSYMMGLFAAVEEEKIAELVHAFLVVAEENTKKEEDDKKPIDFYLSTYGGSADDMFALYDVMRIIQEKDEQVIRTVGLGKVMSAGVLLLAAGTKGERKIAKNCRIMIHSVVGGNQGDLHNMLNEMEAIEQLQQMFVNCLVSETKMTKSRLKKILDRKVNVYLSAEEAVELGIADIII